MSYNNVWSKIVCVLVILALYNCANRGTPTGGLKDEIPPEIEKTTPENYSVNFNEDEIRIYFNEYVKLKNIQKQLVISPPMDYEPEITPLGTASKMVKIKIKDTLKPNTTYAFNFGQSITDNNESNPFSYYRYVFSTGSTIDSLKVSGAVLDAEKRTPEQFVSVMLYPFNETYTDSTVYKEKPMYVTNTLDSLKVFEIQNVKAGTYKLIAIKDQNNNFTYQNKTDKIGFYEKTISVPTDSLYTIKLFKEVVDSKVMRPKQVAGEKIEFGYEGELQNMKIRMLADLPENFEYRIVKNSETDSLYYWYKPKLELDSTYFVVSHKSFVDTLKHRFRTIDRDTLRMKSLQTGTVAFDEDFLVTGTTPLQDFDDSKISIMDKDSTLVPFKSNFDTLQNTYALKFDKSEGNSYKLQFFPDAITDFYGKSHDTLNYSIRTKLEADYGNVRVQLQNAVYPVIIQLITEKGEAKYETYAEKQQYYDFRNVEAGNYNLRVLFDSNKNGVWDTGWFLKQQQPERVSYYPDLLDVRAGWDLIQEFILE
ncbi:MAG: hypothetical protein BM564_04225 [Bacteroidetes bacterium MedPE-SWsnd-G2]|nr:MAG: hypothetical protein BM564_04225 [Bacteroidetes bacterium MedPE-SWsnd-G2]